MTSSDWRGWTLNAILLPIFSKMLIISVRDKTQRLLNPKEVICLSGSLMTSCLKNLLTTCSCFMSSLNWCLDLKTAGYCKKSVSNNGKNRFLIMDPFLLTFLTFSWTETDLMAWGLNTRGARISLKLGFFPGGSSGFSFSWDEDDSDVEDWAVRLSHLYRPDWMLLLRILPWILENKTSSANHIGTQWRT